MDLKLRRVLILDSVNSICEEKLKDAGIQVITKGKLLPEDLIEEMKVTYIFFNLATEPVICASKLNKI